MVITRPPIQRKSNEPTTVVAPSPTVSPDESIIIGPANAWDDNTADQFSHPPAKDNASNTSGLKGTHESRPGQQNQNDSADAHQTTGTTQSQPQPAFGTSVTDTSD